METQGHHLGPDDIAVGLDLGSEKHSVVVVAQDGVTSFEIPHSLRGFEELVRRCDPARHSRPDGRVVYAFEATGHFWEGLAHIPSSRSLPCVIVNPLATFRVREARQMGRDKRDVTDAEQVADLLRTGMVTQGRLLDNFQMHAERSVSSLAVGSLLRLRNASPRVAAAIFATPVVDSRQPTMFRSQRSMIAVR